MNKEIIPMKTSIDTMILQSKLSAKEIDHIINTFKGWYPNSRYDYNLSLERYGVFIEIYTRHGVNFNSRVTLQTKFFMLDHVPRAILDILYQNWSVTSLQIAFDTHLSLGDSFTYKHHGNIKHKQITDRNGHSTLYFGAFRPGAKNNRVVSYDRNQKEISRNMKNGGNHLYSNRYEVQLSFKLGEQPLSNINHSTIQKKLSKYIFVKNINAMDTDGHTKSKLRRIREVYELLDYQYKDQKTKLKAIAKSHREPLEQYYDENKDKLFMFLQDEQQLEKTPDDVRASMRAN